MKSDVRLVLGTAYLEFGCISSSTDGTFVQETLLYGIFPILLIGLVFLGSLAWSRFGSPDMHDVGSTPWEQAKSSALGIGTLVLFLLQPTLVKRTALVMSCVKMGKNAEDVFLTEDLSIRCWYVLFFLFVYICRSVYVRRDGDRFGLWCVSPKWLL